MGFIKDLKHLLNQTGANMVQVMIAFGMVGGLALVMMRINDQGTKTAKSLEARTALKDYIAEITTRFITDGATCTNNFGVGGANAANTRRTDITNAIPNLYDENGAVFLSLNDLILKDVYQVTGINLLPHDNTTGVSGSEGICTLQLQFTVQGNQILGAQIQNHDIDFYCSVDITVESLPDDWHPITNCYPSTSTTFNSLWNLTMIAGREYINWSPNSGLGAMVIGNMSADPTGDDTGSVNLNMDGISLGPSGFNVGVSMAYNSAMSFGNWFLSTEDNGNRFFTVRYWDGEEFHHGMILRDTYLEFSGYQDDAGTTANLQINSVHVRGDTYAWQGTMAAPVKFVGLANLPYDQILSLGMGPAHNTSPGFDYYADDSSAVWVMRQAGYGAGNGEGEHFFSTTSDMVGDPEPGFPNNLFNLRSGFRTKAGANFIFSQSPSLTNCAGCTHNWIYGSNANPTGASDFNLFLGRNLTTLENVKYSVVLGEAINYSDSNLLHYNFINTETLNMNASGRHNYQFVAGEYPLLNHDPYNATTIFAVGRSGNVFGMYTFLSGYRNNGYYDERYATELGVAQIYSLGQHTVGDYPRFRIGQQFTMMSGGGLHLQTGYMKFGNNTPSTPSRLFLGGAKNLMRGGPSDYALIGHNYYRYCDADPVAADCQFYRSPGATTSFGSSFIYMGDDHIVFGSKLATGSTNEARNEVSDSILPGTLTIFSASSGLKMGGNLEARNITTENGRSNGNSGPPSDRRLKEQVESLTEKDLALFWQLQPRRYVFKNNPQKQKWGFIAQEVQQLFPDFVVKNKKTGLLHLSYQQFYALIIKALQSLIELFEDLFGEVAELREKIQRLSEKKEEVLEVGRKRAEYMRKVHAKN